VSAQRQQDLQAFEEAFAETAVAARREREVVARKVAARAYNRELARERRRGSLRFVALCLVLVATAVLVTVAMFQALFWAMG
jgi:cell division septal protein FtsQ